MTPAVFWSLQLSRTLCLRGKQLRAVSARRQKNLPSIPGLKTFLFYLQLSPLSLLLQRYIYSSKIFHLLGEHRLPMSPATLSLRHSGNMERLDLLGFLLITINCNMTIVGEYRKQLQSSCVFVFITLPGPFVAGRKRAECSSFLLIAPQFHYHLRKSWM